MWINCGVTDGKHFGNMNAVERGKSWFTSLSTISNNVQLNTTFI